MTRSADGNRIIVKITDPDKDDKLYINCGWAPGKATIRNMTNADLPELVWTINAATAEAGGRLLDKASSITKTQLTAANGVQAYAGGRQIGYGDTPATPNYQDSNGTAFEDHIFNDDGVDQLADKLPARASDNGALYLQPEGLQINAIANLRVSNSDVLLIEIEKA